MTDIAHYDQVSSVSQAEPFRNSSSSSYATSYPKDYESALSEIEATPTGNEKQEKAFRRAGLR